MDCNTRLPYFICETGRNDMLNSVTKIPILEMIFIKPDKTKH